MNIATGIWSNGEMLLDGLRYIELRTLIAFTLGMIVSGFAVPEIARFVEESKRTAAGVSVHMEPEPPMLVSIRIPAAGINAAFAEELGLDDNGEVEVPERYDTVGWYKYGPAPGETGPAVVLGHVDSVHGPGVFYSLGRLEKGDQILVRREDDNTLVFSVTELEHPSQDAFPTERVYGDIGYAGLRLITCSGTYDRTEGRYTHNLIVYARLVQTVKR